MRYSQVYLEPSHKNLHFRRLAEFWTKNLQNNAFCSTFPGPWTKVDATKRASLLFWNYTFAREGFKEIYLCVNVEDIEDIVAPSTSRFFSGILISIESSQKIRHKKTTRSQHFPIRVFTLKKEVDDIDMVPGQTH